MQFEQESKRQSSWECPPFDKFSLKTWMKKIAKQATNFTYVWERATFPPSRPQKLDFIRAPNFLFPIFFSYVLDFIHPCWIIWLTLSYSKEKLKPVTDFSPTNKALKHIWKKSLFFVQSSCCRCKLRAKETSHELKYQLPP